MSSATSAVCAKLPIIRKSGSVASCGLPRKSVTSVEAALMRRHDADEQGRADDADDAHDRGDRYEHERQQPHDDEDQRERQPDMRPGPRGDRADMGGPYPRAGSDRSHDNGGAENARHAMRRGSAQIVRNDDRLQHGAEGEEHGHAVHERPFRQAENDRRLPIERERARIEPDAPGERSVEEPEARGTQDLEPCVQSRAEIPGDEIDLQIDALRHAGGDAGGDRDRERHLHDLVHRGDRLVRDPAQRNIDHSDGGDEQHAADAGDGDNAREPAEPFFQ